MKTEQIHSLTASFEAHARQTEGGVEFWLARDLQQLLGYSKWDNFLNVVTKAKTACEVSGHHEHDHFADVRKMVDLGFGSFSTWQPRKRSSLRAMLLNWQENRIMN